MNRRFLLISVIISFSLFLFLAGAWFMVRKSWLHFGWTDDILRGEAFRKAASSDRKVLVLGDSQLEFWPFEHCLNKDIAAVLEKNGIGLLNAAHYGFGPYEHAGYIREIVRHFKPDLILLFYFAGNDLTDLAYRDNNRPKPRRYPVIYGEDGKAVDAAGWKEGQSEGEALNFDWELFRKQGMDTVLIQYARNRVSSPAKMGPEMVNPYLLSTASWQPGFLFDNCTFRSPLTQYGWYLVLKEFEGIAELADSIDARLTIAVIPSPVQVDTAYYSFYRKLRFSISYDLLYANTPQQILHEFSIATGSDYIDFLPWFKSDVKSGSLYIKNDDHLSRRGHELAFRVLSDRFLDNWIRNEREAKRPMKKGFYEKYRGGILRYQSDIIRRDEKGFSAIAGKAKENGISVDSQIHLDASYIIENYGMQVK